MVANLTYFLIQRLHLYESWIGSYTVREEIQQIYTFWSTSLFCESTISTFRSTVMYIKGPLTETQLIIAQSFSNLSQMSNPNPTLAHLVICHNHSLPLSLTILWPKGTDTVESQNPKKYWQWKKRKYNLSQSFNVNAVFLGLIKVKIEEASVYRAISKVC